MKYNNESVDFLLKLFHKRVDLQDAYPEVFDGEYQALINWAAGATSNKWIDKDTDSISKFKGWYSKNTKEVVRPKNESLVQEILDLTDCPMNHTFDLMQEESDINEHLPTLFFLIKEFNLKKTLELGVRDGNSTIAIIEATSQIGGFVWSMDMYPCNDAKKRIISMGLDKNWSFTESDDIVAAKKWTEKVDHIFIDTSHAYEHTLQELKHYVKFLKINGFISFHDTRSFPGVLRAIRDFIKNDESKYTFYNYFNNNGFAILRKIS